MKLTHGGDAWSDSAGIQFLAKFNAVGTSTLRGNSGIECFNSDFEKRIRHHGPL